jgi:LPS sulfotransferase NodH
MNTRETLLKLRRQAKTMYTRTVEKAYFRVVGHRVDQRFVIVGNARTGSNYLLAGLQSSPHIRMYHEIFASHNRQVGKDCEKILSTVFQHESKSTRLVGFKVFYNHLTDEEWGKLVGYRDLKVIHLTRRNRLRTVISLEVAFKTGEWTKSGHSGAPKDKRVHLDSLKLLQRLEQIEQGEAAARERFCDRPILEIVYEDMVRSPREVFASVSDYLGVDGIDPGKIHLRRQNPESMADLILNFDEVEAVLKNTRFAEYLQIEPRSG